MHQNWSFFAAVFIFCLVACAVPKAHFEMQPDGGVAPLEVDFRNTSVNADSIRWTFGDGMHSTESNPSHRWLRSGRYTVTLEAIKGKKVSEKTAEVIVESPHRCLVEIQTPYGNMLAELYESTPGHRDNFLKLAEEGFYEGLVFHRVIEGFMIQGGDPASRGAAKDEILGSGGPGYQIPAEFDPGHVHVKGAIAAARTGDAVNPEKKSSGSQFYIVQGQPIDAGALKNFEIRRGMEYSEEQRQTYINRGGTPFLDGEYTVFGRVIDGLEVIDRIAAVQTTRVDRPEEDIPMNVVVIR